MRRLLLLFTLLNVSGALMAQHQNLPFSQSEYKQFEQELNAGGVEAHTAVKPYTRAYVEQYYDLNGATDSLKFGKRTWWGRMLWDDDFVRVEDKEAGEYWFTINPAWDLQIGQEQKSGMDLPYTFTNTRALRVEGGLGKNFSFATAFYETQGRLPWHVDQWIRSQQSLASGLGAGIVPGYGVAKSFKQTAWDYPMAEGYISWQVNKFINIQFGQGKNFIGDGYRSLFLSDFAPNYPYLKINTRFWHIQYTNLWGWMADPRSDVGIDNAIQRKFMSAHYLSWNITDKFNVGFFEEVMFADSTNTSTIDIAYFNPIIFYRPVEFGLGSDQASVKIGLSANWKIHRDFNLYGQWLIDEFTLSEVVASDGYWANKFGWQLGANYFDAFGIKNLHLQAEYNAVRPYTYSHKDVLKNYAHYYQSLAHPWGANFWETVAIARYRYKRLFAEGKMVYGIKGFDPEDGSNYGGDIMKPYSTRVMNHGNEIGQGVRTQLFFMKADVGYILNPTVNLKLFATATYRGLTPTGGLEEGPADQTLYFSFGIRSDLFNNYYDF